MSENMNFNSQGDSPSGGFTENAMESIASSDAAPSRIPGSGFLVLGLVIVVAGGSLYMMRKFGANRNIAVADIKIDYPMDATGSLAPDDNEHIRVLNDLSGPDSSVQVPLDEVREDPFEIPTDEVEIAAGPEEDPEAERLRQLAERKKVIQNAFNSLDLNSVLGGSIPIARISGQPVKTGDTIGEYFTVIAIHGRSVDLMADGEKYTLEME